MAKSAFGAINKFLHKGLIENMNYSIFLFLLVRFMLYFAKL